MGNSGDLNGDARHNNNESRIEENGQRAISFDEDEPMGYRSNAPKAQQRTSNTASIETLQNIMRNVVGRTSKRGAAGDSERRVVNIFVFYNDGRFEQFEPA